MKLITKAIEKKLPSLASAENQDMEELIAILQFFHPLLPWKWNVFGGNKINQDGLHVLRHGVQLKLPEWRTWLFHPVRTSGN